MSRPARALPVDLAPEPWPDMPSEDPYGEVARQFVLRLEKALGDEGPRRVAARAGIGRTTLYNVLSGRTWPDLATIARLEKALGTDLWPSVKPPGGKRS
ncbi:helix-turn-helix domain-containing protein [Frondihabitans cladoniiphilus]|uniref:helix-turn-helix domain-containing protein n=1 Tax=Frondihabitans cladoniiphilus TaxID=715785 RepID=UPI003CD0B2A5